jgi:hypothetical protein
MFSRGNWAIFDIKPSSLIPFVEALRHPGKLLEMSQFTAKAVTRTRKIPAIGINPYDAPRMDERLDPSWESLQAIAKAAESGFANPADIEAINDQLDEPMLTAAGLDPARYLLDASLQIYAFWFVLNEWKDTSDTASFKEGAAYDAAQRPYKFLATAEKKLLDKRAISNEVPYRKQFPVFIDFNQNRVFAENTSKATLLLLQALLGVEVVQVGWRFTDTPWISTVLEKLYADSRYVEAFREAADERTRFTSGEVEKDEDPEIRRLVSNFFSMTQLESELWVGLSTPTAIQLYKSSDPVSVTSPTSATLLLSPGVQSVSGTSPTPVIRSASLVFQERQTRTNKQGEERVYRTDEFTIDLNDNINNTEIGVAFLRGFDLPQFKRRLNREIKKSGVVPEIKRFWLDWLSGMNNAVREVTGTIATLLELDARDVGIQPLFPDQDIQPLAIQEQDDAGISMASRIINRLGLDQGLHDAGISIASQVIERQGLGATDIVTGIGGNKTVTVSVSRLWPSSGDAGTQVIEE